MRERRMRARAKGSQGPAQKAVPSAAGFSMSALGPNALSTLAILSRANLCSSANCCADAAGVLDALATPATPAMPDAPGPRDRSASMRAASSASSRRSSRAASSSASRLRCCVRVMDAYTCDRPAWRYSSTRLKTKRNAARQLLRAEPERRQEGSQALVRARRLDAPRPSSSAPAPHVTLTHQ